MTRRTTNKKTFEWLEKPWVKYTGVLFSIFTLFGAGFWVGIYKNEIGCNLEQMKIRQEFNEKLLNHMTSCQNEKLSKYETSVEELKTMIDNLNNSPNEKQKQIHIGYPNSSSTDLGGIIVFGNPT